MFSRVNSQRSTTTDRQQHTGCMQWNMGLKDGNHNKKNIIFKLCNCVCFRVGSHCQFNPEVFKGINFCGCHWEFVLG